MESLREPFAAEEFEQTGLRDVEPTPSAGGEKRQFVEPAVSDPTNVLEDTKFFFQTSIPLEP